MKHIRILLFLSVVVFSQLGLATRTIHPPSLFWHAFKGYNGNWCATYSSAAFHNVAFTLVNLSTQTQTITITATPVMSKMSGRRIDGTQPLQVGWNDGTSLTLPKTQSITLTAGQSTTAISFSVAYWGPAPAGYYVLDGGLDLLIQINEDRGAVTAVYSTVMEVICGVGAEPDSWLSDFRDVSKTFYVNGGRPF